MNTARLVLAIAVAITAVEGLAQASGSVTAMRSELIGKWSTGTSENGYADLFLSADGKATIRIFGRMTFGECACDPTTVVTAKWKAQSGSLRLSEWLLGKTESGGKVLDIDTYTDSQLAITVDNFCRTATCVSWMAELNGRYFGIQNGESEVAYTLAGDYLLWKGFEFKRQ